jgi:RimJ/RimL family protein N-acetyltransferase
VIVRVASPENHPWLISRLGTQQSKDFFAIEAIDNTGRIHGMVGYDGWAPNSVVMTIALESKMALKPLMYEMFDIAFNRFNKGVALVMIRGENRRSIKLCYHVGFSLVARIRDGVAVGEDYVIMEMRKENCRWLALRKAA